MSKTGLIQYRAAANSLANVLVFDSGVGGLSVTQELVKRLPSVNVTYAADNAEFPFGTKSEKDLIARVDLVLHQLQDISRADLIVVACNTASTIALPPLRQRFTIPIVGVVPAIKPAAKASGTKTIGLLATPGTVTRTYTQDLIDEFAHDCTVISLGSNRLVAMAEQKLAGLPVDFSVLSQELMPLIKASESQNLDTVVLACTHFPLLKPELKTCMPQVKNWVDSGEAIARRVESILCENNAGNNVNNASVNEPPPIYQSIFTQPNTNSDALKAFLEPWFSSRCSVIAL